MGILRRAPKNVTRIARISADLGQFHESIAAARGGGFTVQTKNLLRY
jgi:hypothetical protein